MDTSAHSQGYYARAVSPLEEPHPLPLALRLHTAPLRTFPIRMNILFLYFGSANVRPPKPGPGVRARSA